MHGGEVKPQKKTLFNPHQGILKRNKFEASPGRYTKTKYRLELEDKAETVQRNKAKSDIGNTIGKLNYADPILL